MAIQTEPTRISIPFADFGTKNVIPDTNSTPSASQAASWTDGFPVQCSLPLSAGGIPPARADFNGIFNTMTQSLRFTQEGGVWAWDATVDYDVHRLVLGSDGLPYWSVAQSGPNAGGAQDPTTDNGTYWQLAPVEDAKIVHKTGSEEIAGEKTFTISPKIKRVNPYLYFVETDIDVDVNDSPTRYQGVFFCDKNNTDCGCVVELIFYQSGAIRINPYYRNTEYVEFINDNKGSGVELCPYPDKKGNIGRANRRWHEIFCESQTINTSDENEKSNIDEISADVLDAWGDIDFCSFQFNDALQKKGDSARLHSGLVAQRIAEVFNSHGLDAFRWGLLCRDQGEASDREESYEDSKGVKHVIAVHEDAYDNWGVRYTEALCMEAAYQRRRADRAEARIAALEERLAALEARLA